MTDAAEPALEAGRRAMHAWFDAQVDGLPARGYWFLHYDDVQAVVERAVRAVVLLERRESWVAARDIRDLVAATGGDWKRFACLLFSRTEVRLGALFPNAGGLRMSHHSSSPDDALREALHDAFPSDAAAMAREVLPAPGPTGLFPEGKLRPDDAGELVVAIGVKEGKVVIDFGKAVHWIAFGPEQAVQLAKAIEGTAAAVRMQESQEVPLAAQLEARGEDGSPA